MSWEDHKLPDAHTSTWKRLVYLWLFLAGLLLPFCNGVAQVALPDSLKQQASELEGKEKFQFYYELADEYYYLDLKLSEALAKEAIKLAKPLEDEQSEYGARILLGEILLERHDFEQAQFHFARALELAHQTGDEQMIIKVQLAIAKGFSFANNIAEALAALDEVIRRATAFSDSLILGRALLAKGINLYDISAYEPALKANYKALAIFDALGDWHRSGIVHTNIGMIFLSLHRYDQALAQFLKARETAAFHNDTRGAILDYLNIGVAHQKLGNYKQAREYYQKSLAMARERSSWQDIALLTANLGTTAMEEGNYTEARFYLKRAIAIKDSIGMDYSLAHSFNSLAEINMLEGKYDSAMANALEAGRLSLQTHNLSQLSEAYRQQSAAYLARQDYQRAYEFLNKHKQLSDSIFSQQSDQAISNLNIQYETARKEQEITELSTSNQRRKTANYIFAGIAVLILISGISMIYALHMRRNRDKILLEKEQELHEMQNNFFANISHEFRTPLTLILGPVHNLIRKTTDTKDRRLLKMVEQNAGRLLHLINQILDLTKFDRKVLNLQREPFNLSMMIRGICSSFNSMAEDQGINYTYEINNDHLFMHGDRNRLEIVMINLISNAIKFTPRDGRISVTVKAIEATKTLHIQVSDTGSGISEENIPRVFDRFYHDDRGANSVFEGAGIGLALSKHIVEMHGGTISVESKINEGSVFAVTLPYSPEITNTEKAPVEDINGKVVNEPSPATKHLANGNEEKPIILVVEDRKDMREYLKSFLLEHYRIIEAADATEGWAKALQDIPDAVVSDVMMPGKTGLELCRELKSDIRTSHIPVMLLTAKASSRDRISGLETEADVYLTKPFIPEELELHLRNMLAMRNRMKAFYASHRKIEPAKMAFNSLDEQFLEALSKHLDTHFADDQFSVEQLADLMNLSRSQLHRKTKALIGQSPIQLIRTYRLTRAYDMVSSNAAPIAEIAFHVGFGSPAYFSKCFLEEFGATPSEVKNKG